MTWVQAGNQNLYNDDPIYEISATNVLESSFYLLIFLFNFLVLGSGRLLKSMALNL